MSLPPNHSLRERQMRARYPHGVYGGACALLCGRLKDYECKVKSRRNGNGKKTVTLVCKKNNNKK